MSSPRYRLKKKAKLKDNEQLSETDTAYNFYIAAIWIHIINVENASTYSQHTCATYSTQKNKWKNSERTDDIFIQEFPLYVSLEIYHNIMF